MSTDLPVIASRRPDGDEWSLGAGKDVDVTSVGPGSALPSVMSKRNSEGQVLQVSFAEHVVVAEDIEPSGHSQHHVLPLHGTDRFYNQSVPKVDSLVPVDHTHYEQWARIKGRKVPSSSLLRGIQALKARMKREALEQDKSEIPLNQNRELQIHQLNRNNLLTRDRLLYESTTREKSFVPRPPLEPRSLFKPNAHTIDSELLFKDIGTEINNLYEKQDKMPHREALKPRIGRARISDRCALPISVYQPVSIGDHVFLINEPMKCSEYMRLKSKAEARTRRPDRSSYERLFQTDESRLCDTLADFEPLERANTFTTTSMMTKSKRAPAAVSNAELFDFSQLKEIRNSVDTKFNERSKTEFSFSSRSTRSVKLVPNVRRLKVGSVRM